MQAPEVLPPPTETIIGDPNVRNVNWPSPKNLVFGSLIGLFLLVLVIVVFAISATHAITDPSVAKTAILSIVIGAVVLVLIVGVVVIAVAGIIWGRSDSSSKESEADSFVVNRFQTPLPAVASAGASRQCPVCEATIPDDSPEGLCPKCLLSRCMTGPQTPVRSPDPRQTASYDGPSAVPLPVDLATKFPGLEILELLGQGGMGAVYKARQTKLDRTVAVKILPAEWGKDPAFAERFAREAKALARLSHPHVVAVHDFGECEGLFYLVMEYVDGANLRNILANGGLAPHEALAIVPQICDALQYAHEEGIVHRDIKPENILLDRKGRVKIADFGLAKLIDRPRATFTLTGSQQVMGTLDYMAPEQRLTPQQVDHRADIYSLGVVIYEMLTGELPLGRFAPPSHKSGVDARLDGIVFRALEREPAQRYQRISEVKTDLRAVAASSGMLPTPAPKLAAPRILTPDLGAAEVSCFPVHLGSAWDQQYPGLLRLDGDALILEYSTGYVRPKLKENVIPLRLLRHVRLWDHWFSTSLTLQTASLKVLAGVPTSKQGWLKLGFSRAHKLTAIRMLVAIEQKAPGVAIELSPNVNGMRAVLRDSWLHAEPSPVRPLPKRPPGGFLRVVRSVLGSVYTMFFSRAKNAGAPANNLAHEHTASQP